MERTNRESQVTKLQSYKVTKRPRRIGRWSEPTVSYKLQRYKVTKLQSYKETSEDWAVERTNRELQVTKLQSYKVTKRHRRFGRWSEPSVSHKL